MIKVNIRRFSFALLWSISILLFSCQDSTTLIDINQEINNLKWTYIDKVYIPPIQIENEKADYTLYLNIRHTDDYKYSNLFVLIHQVGPNGERVSERKEFILALPDGEWLGRGSGSLYSHQIPFRKNYRFPKKGSYIFEIEQNMRDNPLNEISDIGLRIEKASD